MLTGKGTATKHFQPQGRCNLHYLGFTSGNKISSLKEMIAKMELFRDDAHCSEFEEKFYSSIIKQVENFITYLKVKK